MKYFTPDLFIAFNSSDRGIAKVASTQWDKAVAAYDKHLRSIRRKLPRQLTDLCLHDAEFIEFEEVSPNSRHAVAHLVLRNAGEIIFLSYFLLEKPSIAQPLEDAVFSPLAVQWLYDEIDCHGARDFSHEILLSDGRVFRFRFEHLSILTAVASAPEPVALRNSASECA